MSLLDKAFESYIILNAQKVNDGYGGTVTTWTEGAKIQCAMQFNNSIEAKIADAQGVSSVYTLTTRKNVTLQYHDVLRRVRDGKIFRVTSDGDDLYTPESASLDMRNVSAEEFVLPQ
jgi:head-tail adaptor